MNRKSLISLSLATCIALGVFAGCGAKTPAGVEDAVVVESLKTNEIANINIKSHNVEKLSGSEYGDQYSAKDTVSIWYNAGNLDGTLPQTVTKSATFFLDSSTQSWEMKDIKTTGCDVNIEGLKGSSWKLISSSESALNTIFGDELPSGDGEVYIRFLKTMGLFSFNFDNEKNTDSERFFLTAGSNSKIIFVGASGDIVEQKAVITGGSVTDSGILNLDFDINGNAISLAFGEDAVQISEHEYDEAMGKVVEGKVYVDSLPTFNVTSSSIVDGEWKTETGLKEGNLSPELTWDAVDGATRYAIVMIDVSTNDWLTWYVVTDTTHLDEGAYTNESIYIGPYPPQTHTYVVYVVALKTDPTELSFQLDHTGGDIASYADYFNTANDGSTGNVLALGTIKADYTPVELYYGYR